MAFDYKEWYKANREKQNAYRREYVNNNPEYKERKRRRDTKRTYGIDDVQLDKLWAQTECAICGDTEHLHIDHNHETGKVRDRLCRPCNLALGFYERTDWRNKVERYLERHSGS